jgi:hypothetical protein
VSQWKPLLVWTEREVDDPSTPLNNEGDFEACVATSYVMGLLYGGVIMPHPYTQAERERLEANPRESQDLNVSDGKAVEVYGHQLRRSSVTTSKTDFLARPGMGYCLTGTGSPLSGTGTFFHEVFGVAQSRDRVRVYDPLQPAGSQPTDMNVADLARWLHGIGPNQVREVGMDEFSGDDMNLKGRNPEPIHNRTTTIAKGGVLVADPTAMPFNNIHTMQEGMPFTPQWRVTGNTILGTDRWLGGWVFTTPPKFGYISEALLGDNPLVPLEEHPPVV